MPTHAGELVPVTLRSRVTEVGTLELWCVARDGGRRWKLEYNVREAQSSDAMDRRHRSRHHQLGAGARRSRQRSARIVSDEIAQLVGAGRGCCRGRRCRRSCIWPASTSCRRRRWRCRGTAPPDRHRRRVRAHAGHATCPGGWSSSAKSWLCHPRVDRLAPILPWGESATEARAHLARRGVGVVPAPSRRRLAATPPGARSPTRRSSCACRRRSTRWRAS